MANTGIERSLTIVVNKRIKDKLQPGYPITYQGHQAFGTYKAISLYELATLSDDNYNTRLTAFKAYVSDLEYGLNIDADSINDSLPFRENLISCPII